MPERMLDAHVALVTGGSKGIGRGIVHRLAASGAAVAFTYSSSGEEARETESLAAAAGGTARGIRCDARDRARLDELPGEVADEFGKLDILVNNAGITRDGLLLRMKDADWDDVLAVNLTSAFHLCRAAAKLMMKKRYGRIVNISSVAGVHGNPGQVNYASAKAGMIGMTKSLAKEIASRGITVNAVAPGFVDTAMTAFLSGDLRTQAEAAIPAGRFGTTEEIASMTWYLCLPESGYITGQVFQVDGGLAT